MATNFEFIEINDANTVARKVGGDYVTQGADDIFHQTGVPLAKRLEEGNIASVSGTPTVITLTGFETHMLLDFNNGIATAPELQLSARYFTGGRNYPVDWSFGLPHMHQAGNLEAFPSDEHNRIYQDQVSFGTPGAEGYGLVWIKLRGAIEVTIQTSSGTIADVDWATFAFPAETNPHTLTTNIQRRATEAQFVNNAGQPYDDGDVFGPKRELFMPDNYWGATGSLTLSAAPTLNSLSYWSGLIAGPATYNAPDVDVYLFHWNEGPTVTDGAAFAPTAGEMRNLQRVIQFRSTPGAGQYQTFDTGRGYWGTADNLNLPLFRLGPTGFGYVYLADCYIVYRGGATLAANNNSNEGPTLRYLLELS